MNNLEQKMLEHITTKKQFNLETALLIASGIDNAKDIAEYKKKIDALDSLFKQYLKQKGWDKHNNPRIKAIAIQEFLYEKNPKRNKDTKGMTDTSNYYLLHKVIDNELNNNQGMANCLGNLQIYAILAKRNGLDMKVVVGKSHVGGRIYDNGRIDIETTCRKGVGRKVNGREYNLNALPAAVYYNNGNIARKKGQMEKAEECFKASLAYAPLEASKKGLALLQSYKLNKHTKYPLNDKRIAFI